MLFDQFVPLFLSNQFNAFLGIDNGWKLWLVINE